MIRLMLTTVALATAGAAFAKLPAVVLDDAAKAKAAETSARAAWAGKMDAYRLCAVQDRIAAKYRSAASAKPVLAPAGMTPTAVVAGAKAAAAAAAPAAAPAAKAGAAPAPSVTTPTQGPATPVAIAAGVLPASGCADPGPFAYTPPSEKPLETAGAHSPAGNASSPPSVRPESAKMAPAQPATAQSKKP